MKYIFVYNAESGLFNAVNDAVHKILSPKTYKCNLCKLTYGITTMKIEWKDFIQNYDIEFKHKDEVTVKDAPAVYDENYNLIISSKQINKCKTLKELIKLVEHNL